MTRITRYGREMRTTFIATMFIACLVIVIGIPFVSKQMFDNEVGYYSISIQGNYIGAVWKYLQLWLLIFSIAAKNLQIIYIWTAMLR